MTSCEIETSENGALDGNWQFRQIDTLSTGGTCDMSHSNIYWAVENHLLLLRNIDKGNQKLLFRFEKEGDMLKIHTPHYVITKDEVVLLDDTSLLYPFGISGPEDLFVIEKNTHESLILRNDLFRLHFRKY